MKDGEKCLSKLYFDNPGIAGTCTKILLIYFGNKEFLQIRKKVCRTKDTIDKHT